MITADQQTEANHNRRMANQHRFLVRRERLEAKIERECLIGELCREGRAVYYFWPAHSGMKKPFESPSWTEVADYIIRNGWVS